MWQDYIKKVYVVIVVNKPLVIITTSDLKYNYHSEYPDSNTSQSIVAIEYQSDDVIKT